MKDHKAPNINNIHFIILTITLVGFSARSFCQNKDSFSTRVAIEQGIIEGHFDTKTRVQKFFGIPYAAPPVGPLRWKAPQPVKSWSVVKETKSFAPRAIQAPVFSDMEFRSNGLSEDCLYLNVWTPAQTNTKDLPVLVYFYGGGFVAGDGSEYRYDGENMAKEGIVVVTVNYRLNIFGFFAHPELTKESPHKASGNYGLLDQHAALLWVQKNIAAFGGDPTKVTIAGESAGSISVSYQMASPLSKDLISGAIGESGAGIHPTLAPVPLAEAEKIGEEFIKKAGYASLDAFRKLPTKEIYEAYVASQRFGFPVVLDNYFLSKTLPEIFQNRNQAQIPLLLGWNSAEIPGMALMQGASYSEENYRKRLQELYPNDSKKVLQLYPSGSEEVIERSATALASDRFIAYSTWKWFDLHRKNSKQAVYRYLYSKKLPASTENTPANFEPIGAPHACEIPYAMGNLKLVDAYQWTEEDYTVSKTMQSYFANFIKTGDPNGADLPTWPSAEANSSTPTIMIIDTESKSVKALQDDRYRFLDDSYGNNE
ncbi:MAG: carboxylesterase [Flavobacteriaceae bacterium]|nr:carboxylesterase [Flavobacteriaceae bacterium]|tara:strand:- start:3839 stop:5458 length:1620 start_codon:yes stop_codon:yes gene_type:complete